MEKLNGKWALVTGASSGFGMDFAGALAERGANLVLVARRREPMEALAARLRSDHGVKVEVIGMDLARPGVGLELKQLLSERDIAVDVLINNAGYGVYGDFVEQALDRTLDMLQLNMLSLTELTHAFAADMVSRGSGHILLVASLGGYQATPTYAAYAASKAYVLLFGEALNTELAPKGVKVSVLSPGITATQFLAVSGQRPTLYQRLVMMRPRPVVNTGLAALFKGKASVIPGLANKLTAFSNRLAPRSLQSKVALQLMKN
ncbi:SDR family oxidoreductase [Chitinimonas sp.]|uniref:SDR family NAD(P)-dependent oxidoreductase n=1 Tax=Chitinimonas sp. TaxID=1934313 RepID=UPI002F95116C